MGMKQQHTTHNHTKFHWQTKISLRINPKKLHHLFPNLRIFRRVIKDFPPKSKKNTLFCLGAECVCPHVARSFVPWNKPWSLPSKVGKIPPPWRWTTSVRPCRGGGWDGWMDFHGDLGWGGGFFPLDDSSTKLELHQIHEVEESSNFPFPGGKSWLLGFRKSLSFIAGCYLSKTFTFSDYITGGTGLILLLEIGSTPLLQWQGVFQPWVGSYDVPFSMGVICQPPRSLTPKAPAYLPSPKGSRMDRLPFPSFFFQWRTRGCNQKRKKMSSNHHFCGYCSVFADWNLM